MTLKYLQTLTPEELKRILDRLNKDRDRVSLVLLQKKQNSWRIK